MALITPYKITEEAINGVTTACAASGDNFVNTGVEFIRVNNAHASVSYIITVTAQTTTYSFPRHGKLTKANTVKEVAAGNSILIGPFKSTVWNDTNGKVQITYKVTSNDALISTISSGVHALTIETLYLEQK
jgi:hypothetical protein